MQSPTYKDWKLHKTNADKLFIAQKSIEIALKYTKNDYVQKDVQNASKIWLPNETKNNNTSSPNASRSLLCIQYVAVAFRSEEEVL